MSFQLCLQDPAQRGPGLPACIDVEHTPSQPPLLPWVHGGCRSPESCGHPAESPMTAWELLQSKISITLTTQTRFAGEELTALYAPCSNSSLLQLPPGGDSRGTSHRRPQGKALLHQPPAGHKHVQFPCELPELKV